jgi:hypothetical protein
MTAIERFAIADVVQKYCRAVRSTDGASEKTISDAMKNGADAQTALARQYYAGLQDIKRFEPAWYSLTEIDQHTLEVFYGWGTPQTGAAKILAEEYDISLRQAYYLCSKARQRFADALAALTTTKEKGADDDEETNS